MVDQIGVLPFRADRWVPFIRTLSFYDVDFTGATFAAQVRVVPDASGAALVTLGTVGSMAAEGVALLYAGSATIAAHIAAGRIAEGEVPDGYDDAAVVFLSQVGIRINETTVEGLPFPAERGDDLLLAWDLHITLPGGVKEKWLEGAFTVHAGVTQ